MRLLWLAAAVVAGLALGGLAALGLQGNAAPQARRSQPPVIETPTPPGEEVLLAWSSGGLPDGFADRVAADRLVTRVTVVHGGLLELVQSWDAAGRPVDVPGAGLVIPLDALAVDPATYPAFLPASSRSAFEGLRPGEALLGTTSARLRRLEPGGVVMLADGSNLTIAGVVDDALVAGAELVTRADQVRAEPRYLLVGYDGDRAAVEEALRALVPGGIRLRIRGPGEAPFLRHGDAVLSQALVKERFGEFAYRREGDTGLVLQDGWEEQHLATADLPLVGPVRCHRALLPALAGALEELAKRNLGYLVDPQRFAGCHSPRLTSSADSVSRHAWGAAVDLGADDPQVVEVLQRWGLYWGGEWLVPDPGHYEYVREP